MKKSGYLILLVFVLFFGTKASALPPGIIGVTSTDPKCIGVDNGSILISATGTGTILYSIDSGATFQTSNSFTGLPAGTFDIIVPDVTGDTFIPVVLSYQ